MEEKLMNCEDQRIQRTPDSGPEQRKKLIYICQWARILQNIA